MYSKKWQLIIAMALISCGHLSCDNRKQGETAQATASGKMPKITFAEKGIYDFGTLTEGDTVEHVFKFTNTGEFPLIINNITASCGCTTPEWPREPVAPGAAGSIRVRFNSRGKSGEQNKTITVIANTDPAMTDLQFKALVNPKADSTKKS
ncbi:hypothetical protein GCM10028806_25900 [Spirosoma terrae]|jgi:hypothetical protein|uniref:DUF1573 domain-containing protein n=1 Tax=Spirosoma terrae TaxID=1968276 RepID=A0A6L9LEZ8_9BACT|nr:DUF1573 domain-containing protein [Spirosoma terrae]NDU97058.1 DUF1573 domain-containing protein [Spirosoma terrae]